SPDQGLTFGASTRLDDVGTSQRVVTDPLSASLDNRWHPAVAIYKRQLFVAWSDFRNYNWDIYLARARVTQTKPRRNVRVDDFPTFERVDTDASLAVDPVTGIASVAWTDIRAREADSNVFFARATSKSARTLEANRQLDGSRAGFDPDTDTPTTQSHPAIAAAGGHLCAAWQDDRNGTNDIFFTSSADGGATFAADERVDDAGAGPSAQTAPAIAIDTSAGTRCYVV